MCLKLRGHIRLDIGWRITSKSGDKAVFCVHEAKCFIKKNYFQQKYETFIDFKDWLHECTYISSEMYVIQTQKKTKNSL